MSGSGGSLSPLGAWGQALTISWEKEFSKTRMGKWVIFICMELYPSVSKAPFPLNQFGKWCIWGFSSVQSKASVQSFRFMVELNPAQHQASRSPLVNCVGVPHGYGPRGQVHSMRGPQARSQTRAAKEKGWELLFSGVYVTQILRPCNGHTCSGQWPVPRCNYLSYII